MRGLVRDARRDPSSNDDVAGLEALDYWIHLCDCARRKTDVSLFVSNEYLSFRFGCIIEPTGFIMNKHTWSLKVRKVLIIGEGRQGEGEREEEREGEVERGRGGGEKRGRERGREGKRERKTSFQGLSGL